MSSILCYRILTYLIKAWEKHAYRLRICLGEDVNSLCVEANGIGELGEDTGTSARGTRGNTFARTDRRGQPGHLPNGVLGSVLQALIELFDGSDLGAKQSLAHGPVQILEILTGIRH